MSVRIFFSVIFGTVILFAWNAVSWMFLPFHTNSLTNLPAAVIDTANIQQIMPYDGVFHYPGLPEDESPQSWKELEAKIQTGPRITLMVYKAGGTTLFDPKTFVISGILNLLTVILELIVLSKLQDKSFSSVWSTCVIIGAIIGLVSDFAQMNWFLFPLDYTVANVFDHLVAFTLLGIFFGVFTFKKVENSN